MIKVFDGRKGTLDELFKMLSQRSQLEMGDVLRQAEAILKDVKLEGDTAVFRYTEKFDRVILDKSLVKVTAAEIEEAYSKVDKKLLDVIRKAKANIEDFHQRQKDQSWFTTKKDGVILGQMLRPLEIAGVYVPGGTAAYPSSVLMNIIPAKAAGVEKVIMVTPPKAEGINPVVLVAANEAGADEIYKVGGVQAVGALAYGTESIPKVDKIVGPGNAYVAAAKKLVYGFCDIDAIAGPSEITVVADSTSDIRFIAADLLSQAEHDVLASSVLVTDSEDIANSIGAEIERQLLSLPRKEIAQKSIDSYGAVVLVSDMDEALQVVNRIAPEHLELCVKEPFSLLSEVKNAGAVFLGNFASEPLGDYLAGPNHVLPTSGTARFFSPLSVDDFIKKTSVISYTKKALSGVKDDIIDFAESEGLTAHANAIRVRFSEE
ncbi:MAG TPA: histidinol dehydrogenase [Clostridia bacterium]